MELSLMQQIAPQGCFGHIAGCQVSQHDHQAYIHTTALYRSSFSATRLVRRIRDEAKLTVPLIAAIEMHLYASLGVREWSMRTDKRKESDVRAFYATAMEVEA